jgi:putative transposase
MTAEISAARSRKVNHKRVGRLMREHGLQSHKRRRFRVVTTDSRHAHPVAPNVLGRDFEATAPNQKWLADLTYVPTDEGWLYLALVLDLYARKLVGWAMSETMPQELTLSALDVALGWRDPLPAWCITRTAGRSTRRTTIERSPRRAASPCR